MKCRYTAMVLAILPTQLAAQGLECKTISATMNVGMGAIADPVARIGAADLAAGYKVTGGGCDFGGPSADNFGMVIWSKPVDDGYACKARASSGNTALTATAFATLCRVKRWQPDDVLRRAPFSNVGLGGGTVAIARADRGTIPFSIRACNLSGGVPIEFDLSATLRVRVELGQCVEVDKPQRTFFRTPTSVDIDVQGNYELFERGTFPTKPRVGPRKPVDSGKRVVIEGPLQSAVANCRKPAQGEPFDAKSYWGYCPLSELKANKNYRVCFDNGFTGQGQKLEYPGALLPIVHDKALMARPNPGQLDSYHYTSIAPTGCRDIFGVNEAWILIVGDNTWNGQVVSAVTYRYAEIPSSK